MQRRCSNKVMVGKVAVGGNAPISVQSMLNIPAEDVEQNIRQARLLQQAGCDIIRVAVPSLQTAALVGALKRAIDCPIVADIHFDYRIALACVAEGVDKIRINPGNIGDADRVKAVAEACRKAKVPIRIGVNSGSVEKSLLQKYGGPTPQAMVDSAMAHARLLEQNDFHDIILSLKSSDTGVTVDAYRLAARQCPYPLHLGVTEAGSEHMGTIKSAAAIGGLLLSGIGDTIRISLTADPVKEVSAALDLLRAAGLRKQGVQIVSCPTCGRTKIDLIGLANEVEKRLAGCTKNIKVAVMGCVVNGPGEAKEADVGIAGGDGCGLIFKKGRVIRKVEEKELVNALMEEINAFTEDTEL